MEKVVFVAHQPGDTPSPSPADVEQLNQRLLGELPAERYLGISLQLEDRATTDRWQRRTEPVARRFAATLSVWVEAGEDTADAAALVDEVWPDHVTGVVTEAVVRWNGPRQVSATQPLPGHTVTALLYRPPSLTHDQLVRHWIDVHQPMSLRIHPARNYVRNVVARVLPAAGKPASDDPFSDTTQFDAISDEYFASLEDILDPSRFYGSDVSQTTWQQNATTIGDDVGLFLDGTRMAAAIMDEYLLRDFRAPRTPGVS
ncbi:EthD domain-containing protein [Frankia sp. Ag45/Mut15]|uniref:EthD domain-containing protein n=1 Tax=Frankia umida TaxID=573489 RepID=A0ABT0K1A4_9ACTN|nr:EthD domain-containing protein [Frankia umida]MCK9877575.1 EthD domain-containing protein [Frankia umida]